MTKDIKERNKIIEYLYNNGIVSKMSIHYCKKYGLIDGFTDEDNVLIEDITQEVFCCLAEMNTDYLLKVWRQKPKSKKKGEPGMPWVHSGILSLLHRTFHWKIFALSEQKGNSKTPRSPNRSFIRKLLDTSNHKSINDKWGKLLQRVDEVELYKLTDDEETNCMFRDVFNEMSDEEKEFMNNIFQTIHSKEKIKNSQDKRKLKQLKIKKDIILIKNNHRKMTIEQAVEHALYFNQFLDEHRIHSTISISQDDRVLLSEVWYFVSGLRPDVNCISCVKDTIEYLQSFAQRNKQFLPVYKESVETCNNKELTPVSEPVEVKEPEVKKVPVKRAPRKKTPVKKKGSSKK